MGNFLFGFTLYHAHYIFIRVANDLVYSREGGRQCCFMSLSALLFDRLDSSACCHWTARKRGPYLGIWRQNEFRFFARRIYTRYGNAFQKQSPFRCTLDCSPGRGGGLPYKKGGDARWENLNEPLKGTNVGVA